MSGDNPNEPEKPFLPDEELGTELDAWDSTFDALHGESEAPAAYAQESVPAPAGEAQASSHIHHDRAVTANAEVDLPVESFSPPNRDGQESIESRPTPTSVPVPADLAAEFADTPTPDGMPEYEEPVAAARPLSPPVHPMPTVVAPAATKRTGPAIVRRAVPASSEKTTQPRQLFPEAGRASSDKATRPRELFSEATPLPVPDEPARSHLPPPGGFGSSFDRGSAGGEQAAIDDDDYVDMEIGGNVSSADSSTAVAIPARRTVAHVVRRSAVPTQAPELKSETIRTTAVPSTGRATSVDEADFSDLAEGPQALGPMSASTDEGEDDFVTEPARPKRILGLRGAAEGAGANPDSDAEFDRRAGDLGKFGTRGAAGIIDLAAIRFPEQVQPLSSAQFDEQVAQAALLYERELAVDERPALHIEIGRLQEHLGDLDRAQNHYSAALRADPVARSAMRGLRRLACGTGNIAQALEHLNAEIAVAGVLEVDALRDHRIELLLAAGDYEQAREAIGASLASAPRNVRALLAATELAVVGGSADEISAALERLADAVTDPGLRSALHSARGTIAGHDRDHSSAIAWYATAAQSDPSALGPRVAMAQHLAAQGNGEATAEILVEMARRLKADDPVTAAALAIRAQFWSTSVYEAASSLARAAMPSDALVTRVVAESAIASGDPVASATAMSAWAHSSASPAERAYAAGRAAEFDPDGGVDLWRIALEADVGDDYVAAQLRTALVATAGVARAIEVDLEVARDASRQRVGLRAGFGLLGEGRLDEALRIFERYYREHPASLAVMEALAEGYAAAGRWTDRAQLLAEIAQRNDDPLDRDGAQLRSAVAWEEAVGAVAATAPNDSDEVRRLTEVALDTWGRILARSSGVSSAAHAAAIVLATRLGDPHVIDQVLARAQTAETSPWAATSLALRRARPVMRDPASIPDGEAIVRASSAARGTKGPGEDPRRTLWLIVGAARRHTLADAATALEERANVIAVAPEAAVLQLRAAQLSLDSGDAARAVTLIGSVQAALPTLPGIAELLAIARRKAGVSGPVQAARAVSTRSDEPGAAFAYLIRDAETAIEQEEAATAIDLLQRALALRPSDPMASLPLSRAARLRRDATPLRELALAQLRAAERANNAGAIADANGQLALLEAELPNNNASVISRLESALRADPTRLDLLHRLVGELSKSDRIGHVLSLRRAELDQLPLDVAHDRAALLMDVAGLAERDGRSDQELTPLYRDVLAAEPRHRQALLLLESVVRRAGSSPELAQLEEQVARYFEGDARAQAAFYTRTGETLAELDQVDAAVQKFGMADEVLPGHVPALAAWRTTAMKGQLWIDVAQAVTRLAATNTDASARARQHHFAGVALMDKALVGDQAMVAFRKALEADPRHKDAFVRLRILLEEDANHDELALVLSNRLQVEPEPAARLEIHRALAELHRNFLDARDVAKSHYREILAVEPNDLRAHAAIADIAWEQGNWQEAADSLIVRAKLERDPVVLSTLCYRLGLLYADRLSDPAMALRAFQRALTYQPDDINTLVRLVDLASVAGEWKLALGACERLVTIEQDPDQRVAHLHRVAKVFRLGFGDAKRAERALNLALDGAPTNDEALTQLVQFYREAGDMTSVRVHLNRVIGAMRSRLVHAANDGIAYRVIARAMAAREGAGVSGSLPVARAAAELAILLDAGAEPEHRLVADPRRIEVARLLGSEVDEVLFPRGLQSELRQLFKQLDDRIAKLVGFDLRTYGVSRGDRLRPSDSPVAGHAQEVANALGFDEIDVYISNRMPFAMVADPSSPGSLVIGQRIADTGGLAVRFAAGAALKLAQAGLAVPARLDVDDLGNLVVATLRCFQPEFPSLGLDDDAIAMLVQKLRRALPTALLTELRPLALAIDGLRFSHQQLAIDVQMAGFRAGVIASGSITAGLQLLAARRDLDVLTYLSDREAQQLIAFAIGEDHASVAR